MGKVEAIQKQEANIQLKIRSGISSELKINQSVTHNGVCLTVVNTNEDTHSIEVIQETLGRSNLGELKIGDQLNLERAMLAETRKRF